MPQCTAPPKTKNSVFNRVPASGVRDRARFEIFRNLIIQLIIIIIIVSARRGEDFCGFLRITHIVDGNTLRDERQKELTFFFFRKKQPSNDFLFHEKRASDKAESHSSRRDEKKEAYSDTRASTWNRSEEAAAHRRSFSLSEANSRCERRSQPKRRRKKNFQFHFLL